MPDMKQEMIKQVIRAYNESANYGNVPADLYDLDPSFWLDIASDKMCDLLEDCRQNAMQSGLDLLDCTIVPCAEATTYSTYHVLSTYINPHACTSHTSCYFSDVDSGSGSLQTNQSGGQIHANSLWTRYAIVNQSFVDTFPVSHEVSARIQIGHQEKTLGPFVGIDEINQRDSVYLGGRCGGGTGDERNCGTFSLTVYAEPATFET